MLIPQEYRYTYPIKVKWYDARPRLEIKRYQITNIEKIEKQWGSNTYISKLIEINRNRKLNLQSNHTYNKINKAKILNKIKNTE